MDLPEAIEQIRPSVVQIRIGDAILGTGFFVDEDAHVVTAKHVIDGGRGLAQGRGLSPEFATGMAAPNMQNASFPGATNITVMRSFTIIGSEVVAKMRLMTWLYCAYRQTPSRARYLRLSRSARHPSQDSTECAELTPSDLQTAILWRSRVTHCVVTPL